jgi:hypothetical protein
MPAKTFTGARFKLYVDNVLCGIFDSCSYAINIGAEPIPLLGRFGPAEITPTSYEAVTVNCSGFRLIGNGGHKLPKVPKLQDLLNLEAVQLVGIDRQDTTNTPILTVDGCVAINYSGGANAKATSRIQITYLGIKASDESGEQSEVGATELP